MTARGDSVQASPDMGLDHYLPLWVRERLSSVPEAAASSSARQLDAAVGVFHAQQDFVHQTAVATRRHDALRIQAQAIVGHGTLGFAYPFHFAVAPGDSLVGLAIDADAITAFVLGEIAGRIGGTQQPADIRGLRIDFDDADAAGDVIAASLPRKGAGGELDADAFGVLISSADSLWHLDASGQELWRVDDLGVDGVVIFDVKHGVVHGSGEWDPPGGWLPFEVELRTGRVQYRRRARRAGPRRELARSLGNLGAVARGLHCSPRR